MKKRGQFFLVAALVIIAVVASLATVYNNVQVSEEDVSVYDLSDEINYEILQYLDSGSFYALSSEEIDNYLSDLIQVYAQSYPQTEIVIVYGNKTTLTWLVYNLTNIGGPCLTDNSCWPIAEGNIWKGTEEVVGNQATVTFGTTTYTFDVKEEGQNFFLVLKKEGDGDIFVSKKGEDLEQCGNSDQECCSPEQGRPSCNTENLFCDEEGICAQCGGKNQLCCPTSDKCEENLICYKLSGQEEQKCYESCTGNYCDQFNEEGISYTCKNNGQCQAHR